MKMHYGELNTYEFDSHNLSHFVSIQELNHWQSYALNSISFVQPYALQATYLCPKIQQFPHVNDTKQISLF